MVMLKSLKKETKMEILKSKNFTVRIEQDFDPRNPRDDVYNDNFSTMYCKHRRYNLGDNLNLDTSTCDNWQEVKQALIAEFGEMAIIEPLSLYDHSGISISIGTLSGWDCGQVGFVFITKKQVREIYDVKRITKATLAKAQALIKCEVEDYNSYLTGDIYNLSLYKVDSTGEDDELDNELDSCGGIWGYDHALKEAQLMLDNAEANFAKQAQKDWDNFGLERMKSLFAQILAPSNQPHLQLFGI